MDNNIKNYIDGLKVSDIPWGRMVTAYGTALHYPEYISQMENAADKETFMRAFSGIADLEHQDTMFPPAPFALVFLVRIYEKLLAENTALADEKAAELTRAFENYMFSVQYAEQYEHDEPVEYFSDMLSEEYLLDERFACTEPDDEELDELFGDEELLTDPLFYSIYHYSGEVLSQVPDLLEKYGKFTDRISKMRDTLA